MNSLFLSFRTVNRICRSGKRFFLSEAYKCQEAWEQRLSSPLIQKINIDDMYQELDQMFQTKGNASAIDVDLFSHKVTDENYADELEDIIHKFRLSPNTSRMLSSTPHAVVRSFMDMGKFDALMRILDDRLNYGIFPDYHCTNLMMDTLLKQENYRDAAKVATFQMLQEDWNHPITSYMALYACHMYLIHGGSEPWDPNPPENNEPQEEVKVRVMYIRNPFFDDHFDLKDPNHLIGKTLVTLSRALPVNDPVRKTYEFVGWALYEKWNKAKEILQELSSSEEAFILLEGVSLIEKAFAVSGENQSKDEAKEFLELVGGLPSSKLRGETDSLLSGIKEKVNSAVLEHEQQDIAKQLELYKIWEKDRVELLRSQMEQYDREMRLKKVEEKKREIAEKEEILFFFDKKDELDMLIERNEEIKQKQVKKKKKVKETDEDYIPPDVK